MAKRTEAHLSPISNVEGNVRVSTLGTKAAPGSKLVSYKVSWDDGQIDKGIGNPLRELSHSYLKSGNYNIILNVKDSKNRIAEDIMGMIIDLGNPQPPIPPTSRGPQASITCPIGSVAIPAGSTTASRQTVINANPNGTVFCLAAGIHFATGSNTPKTNQQFIGQFGAIIDGTSWPRPEADLDASPFKAINNGITGVVIKNLVIQNMPSYGIDAYLTSSTWTVDHCEITGCRTGLSVSNNSQVTNNFIHHNFGIDGDPNPALRGGGYVVSQTIGVLFDNNEVSYNGREQKFLGSDVTGTDNLNYIVTNNYFHHNRANGFWSDGNGAGGVVQNNTCEFNLENGIVLEKGFQITCTFNAVNNNVQSGILNQESRDCIISDNIIQGNNISIDMFIDLSDVGTAPWGIDLRDNIIERNTIVVPSNPGTSFAVVFAHVGAGDFTPYTNNTKQNNFNFNNYTVSGNFNWWFLQPLARNWSQWQAIPQDVNGSISGL